MPPYLQDFPVVQFLYHKIHLPNYDVFDERRYFHSGDSIGIFNLKVNSSDYKIALQICEDLWEDEYERKISKEIIENNPDLIIADEATSSLDSLVKKDILKLLIQLKKEFKTSLIIVSHNLNLIYSISNYVLVMNRKTIK